MQSDLLTLVADVLGLSPDEISRRADTASFIQLGGTSLRAAELIALARKGFGTDVPVSVLLSDSVLATALAAGRPVSVPLEDSRPAIIGQFRAVSAGQASMLLSDDLGAGSPFHLLFSSDLTGSLDVQRLLDALRQVTAAHEALRTVFSSTASGFQARVLTRWEPRVVRQTLAAADVSTIHEMATASRHHWLRPFEAPPIAFFLTEVAKERHVLTLLAHHAVVDGFSIGLLWQQIFQAYQDPQAQLPSSSADMFSATENSADTAAALTARADELRNIPTTVTLPSDLPRPAQFDRIGARMPAVLDTAVRDATMAVAAECGVTRNAVLLAAWALVVSRRTGADKLLVGMSAAGRSTAEAWQTMGLGTKLLPVLCGPTGPITARRYVTDVAAGMRAALSTSDVPFEHLVSKLGAGGDPARNPLTQIGFAAHDELIGDAFDCGKLTVTVHEGHCRGTVFDAILFVQHWGEQPRLALEFASSVLLPQEAAQLAAEFHATLLRLCVDLEQEITAVSTLVESSADLEFSNGPTVSADDDMWQLVSTAAKRNPNAVAIRVEDGQELTYAQLTAATEAQAAMMAANGVTIGDHVIIALPRSAEEIVTILATLRLGAAYIGLDEQIPEKAAEDQLRIASPRAIMTVAGRRTQLARLAPAAAVCEPIDPWNPPSVAAIPPAAPRDPARVAYVGFTSGSTGRPKGVQVPHRAVARLVKTPEFCLPEALERFLRLAPLAFDASTLEIFAPLVAGRTVEVLTDGQLTAEALGTFLRQRHITGLWLTSGLFRLLVDHCPEAFADVRQVLTGGDVVPPQQVAKILLQFPKLRVTNGYGPTENTTFTTVHHVDDPAEVDGSLPIGRPIQGGGVLVVDETGRTVPPGAAGELLVYGLGLANGYLHDPDETDRRFITLPNGQRCYRTGDLVRWDTEGRIRFLGRIDHQVKVRGFRVELDAVASVLRDAPGVIDAAVYTTTAGTTERRLIAGVVAAPGVNLDLTLREHAGKHLPEYAVPSLWAIVSALPLTLNGKVDVAALAEIAMGKSTESVAPLPPCTQDIEDAIAGVWETALGLTDFGYDDRFFDVGGDSLQLPHVRTLLRQALPAAEVTVLDLLRFPTISELARHIEQTTGARA